MHSTCRKIAFKLQEKGTQNEGILHFKCRKLHSECRKSATTEASLNRETEICILSAFPLQKFLHSESASAIGPTHKKVAFFQSFTVPTSDDDDEDGRERDSDSDKGIVADIQNVVA